MFEKNKTESESAEEFTSRLETAHNTDRSELLSLLDHEIDQHYQQMQRPGWTVWAIIAALAWLVWTMFDLADSFVGSWLNVRLDVLGLLDLVLLIVVISKLLCQTPSRRSTIPRFEFANNDPAIRLQMMSFVGICIAVIVSLSHDKDHIYALVWWSAIAIACLCGIIFVVVLVLSFSRWPIPLDPPRKYIAGITASILLMLGSVVALNFVMRIVSGTTSIDELRIACVLMAMVLLSLIVARHARISPLLESLSKTRRELCLGQITLDDARRRTDIVLHGLDLHGLFEEEISSVIHVLNLATRDYEIHQSKLQMLDDEVPSEEVLSQKMLSEQELNHIIEVAKEAATSLEHAKQHLDSLKNVMMKLESKRQFVQKLADISASSFDGIKTHIVAAAQQFDERVKMGDILAVRLKPRLLIVQSRLLKASKSG